MLGDVKLERRGALMLVRGRVLAAPDRTGGGTELDVVSTRVGLADALTPDIVVVVGPGDVRLGRRA